MLSNDDRAATDSRFGEGGLNRRRVLLGSTALAVASAIGTGVQTAAAQAQTPSPQKPNILFMLADNLGYGVPSCYNGGILDTPTPRIDRLAADGLRLTNFNVENQ